MDGHLSKLRKMNLPVLNKYMAGRHAFFLPAWEAVPGEDGGLRRLLQGTAEGFSWAYRTLLGSQSPSRARNVKDLLAKIKIDLTMAEVSHVVNFQRMWRTFGMKRYGSGGAYIKQIVQDCKNETRRLAFHFVFFLVTILEGTLCSLTVSFEQLRLPQSLGGKLAQWELWSGMDETLYGLALFATVAWTILLAAELTFIGNVRSFGWVLDVLVMGLSWALLIMVSADEDYVYVGQNNTKVSANQDYAYEGRMACVLK